MSNAARIVLNVCAALFRAGVNVVEDDSRGEVRII